MPKMPDMPKHSDKNGDGNSKAIGKGKKAVKSVRKVAPSAKKLKKA